MIIAIDSSVLINFLKIDRMGLLSNHNCRIIAPNHVSEEISGCYPDQRQRFAEAIGGKGIAIEALAPRRGNSTLCIFDSFREPRRGGVLRHSFDRR